MSEVGLASFVAPSRRASMDTALVTSAITGIRFIKDSLEVALGYKIENESSAKINEALKQVGAIQDTFFELREELFRLQSENQGLRGQLKAKEGWESQKSQYSLEETARGAIVYAFQGTPKHYACQSCFEKESIQILQDQDNVAGTFQCPGCKTHFPIKPRKTQQKFATGTGNPLSSYRNRTNV
jgi:hypothetical protein